MSFNASIGAVYLLVLVFYPFKSQLSLRILHILIVRLPFGIPKERVDLDMVCKLLGRYLFVHLYSVGFP